MKLEISWNQRSGKKKTSRLFHDGECCTTSPTRFSSNFWRNYWPLTQKILLLQLIFRWGIFKYCLETFGFTESRKKVMIYREVRWRPLSACSIFIVFFFFGGKLFIVFPGYNSPRKLSKLFFLIIRFIIGRWLKSLYEKWKVLKVVWQKAPKKQKKRVIFKEKKV